MQPARLQTPQRKVLQSKMTPQLDVPVLLKVAPDELCALGIAYAKGKQAEAQEIRADGEKALQKQAHVLLWWLHSVIPCMPGRGGQVSRPDLRPDTLTSHLYLLSGEERAKVRRTPSPPRTPCLP